MDSSIQGGNHFKIQSQPGTLVTCLSRGGPKIIILARPAELTPNGLEREPHQGQLYDRGRYTLLSQLNSTASASSCWFWLHGSVLLGLRGAHQPGGLYNAIQMISNGILGRGGGQLKKTCSAHFQVFGPGGPLVQVPLPRRPAAVPSTPPDGFVLGEGGGMIVIERESVAKKRGARVYSYITGVGASNNDRGMVESVAETQKIAIRAGFEDANYGPETVDLVECHATATVQGDLEEIRALKSFYSNGRRVMLSSFKSQIGHSGSLGHLTAGASWPCKAGSTLPP
jgi:hypothetical protein